MTASDCPDYVAINDPRAEAGATYSEPADFTLDGTCVMRGGEVVGALYGDEWASCHQEWVDAASAVTAVMQFDAEGVGRGMARLRLTGLPRSDATECTIEGELVLEPRGFTP